MTNYNTILVEQRGRVGWITLNRPEALNALNTEMAREVTAAAQVFDADDSIGAIVLTGSERAFAAGADIKEMAEMTEQDMLSTNHFGEWTDFAAFETPVIAAVGGFALGGGCEVAMMCDIIVASDSAKFGQPEINLGVIPGMGGSQRLARAVGPFKAAELVLTGRMIGADEAERVGLVSRVFPADQLLAETDKIATAIASKSLLAAKAAKAALKAVQELPLSEGLAFEKRTFASLFGTADQREGMAAFSEKRQPTFTHR